MFIKTLTAAAVLALSAATASADFACRAPEPSHEQIEDAKAFFSEWKATAESLIETGASLLPRATVNVKTYVHVVAASKSKYITQTQVNNQIKAMNQAYAPSGFQFTLAATDFTANSNWAQDGNEMAMKKALRKGTYSDLNLYFVETPADGALGYCYFPVSGASGQSLTQDGCTIMAQSVPGGTAAPYNLGGTAIHEVGHWMNLFHTFQGGCSQGDQVDDTPAQASASSGCPTGRDSCPNNAGVDPIHNYMDYSDDSCYEEFTAGQQARMHDAWTKYRS